MRIIDWRHPSERFLTSRWGNNERRATAGGGWLGSGYTRLHDWVMDQRVVRRQAPTASPLVVSIGNLALGGTGKTPVTIALALDLAAAGRSGCVLTRGFRSPLAGPLTVTPDNRLAGDEARLLAGALAGADWQVVQARDRQAGLWHIRSGSRSPEICLLEDGHQTAGVGRACDVLILDHWAVQEGPDGSRVVPQSGSVFPFGPWRESARGAARADIWLLETDREMPSRGLGNSRVATFSRELSLRRANAAAGEMPTSGGVALVSGIARPQQFERGAQELLSSEVGLAVRLADHEPYGEPLVRRLVEALRQNTCDKLVTTAKDWVKLAALWPEDIPALVADLKIVWGHGETLTDLISERL